MEQFGRINAQFSELRKTLMSVEFEYGGTHSN